MGLYKVCLMRNPRWRPPLFSIWPYWKILKSFPESTSIIEPKLYLNNHWEFFTKQTLWVLCGLENHDPCHHCTLVNIDPSRKMSMNSLIQFKLLHLQSLNGPIKSVGTFFSLNNDKIYYNDKQKREKFFIYFCTQLILTLTFW